MFIGCGTGKASVCRATAGLKHRVVVTPSVSRRCQVLAGFAGFFDFRVAAIKVELGDAERLECALIGDALDNAVLIDHRPNVDIRALLGLVVSKKKANAA
jgi:hypothetical protein